MLSTEKVSFFPGMDWECTKEEGQGQQRRRRSTAVFVEWCMRVFFRTKMGIFPGKNGLLPGILKTF
jgi:hypothetical protein